MSYKPSTERRYSWLSRWTFSAACPITVPVLGGMASRAGQPPIHTEFRERQKEKKKMQLPRDSLVQNHTGRNTCVHFERQYINQRIGFGKGIIEDKVANMVRGGLKES